MWHDICSLSKMHPCAATTLAISGVSWARCAAVLVPTVGARGAMGELKMASLKQYFGVLAVGVILVVGLTNCVVTPAPVSSGYVVSPPVVVIQPYRTYQYYYPHRYYRPYHHHRGWHPHRHRW
jgi:hypothetical protein